MDDTQRQKSSKLSRQFSLKTFFLLILAAALVSAYSVQHERIRRLERQVETLLAERAEGTRWEQVRMELMKQKVELLQKYGPLHPRVQENQRRLSAVEEQLGNVVE